MSCISWLPLCVQLTSLTLVNFSNSGRVHTVTPGWPANCAILGGRTFASVVQHLRDRGTFKPQTHDRGRDRTERMQAEEQILERVREEPHIITRRFAAEVRVSQCIVH
ncbi:hypothetical protein Zmor_002723 [Zophobas morio]|uniref:Uncharacterized protein n=1 Tax=Zophobas morio TaxID=2755281 RepID=A0AA38HL87_9CUCU|nr:hypothetical protein Zmor_002723 [Zophobas morio]